MTTSKQPGIIRQIPPLRTSLVRYGILLTLLTIPPSDRGNLPAQQSSAEQQGALAQGLQLLRAGQPQQAKVEFDLAVKAAPRSADAYAWRGICENQLTQFAAAAADFRLALHLNPALLAAHYNLALSFIRLHEIDHAIEQLRLVIVAQPESLPPRYNLAILLEGKGLLAEAVTELDAAHAIDPSDKGVTLHLLLDRVKVSGSSQTASLVSELAEASTPPQVQRQAGTALIEAAKFADAITILESARARAPQEPGIDSLLARAYIGDQKNAEAIALLQALPTTQNDAEQVYFLALAYTGAGDVQHAEEAFGAAARLDPRDARPLYHLGLLAAASSQGQLKSAELLRSAVALDPGNAVYSLALARVLLVSDQADEATIVLSRMRLQGEDAAQGDTLKGVAAAATHGIDQAIPQLRRAILQDPGLALAHNVLGFCLFQQGKYAEAAEAYGRASTLEPKRPLYARDAALAYERANRMDQALSFAEQANAIGGAGASDHLLLGKLYAAAGRKLDAVRELRRAAELNPDLDAPCYLLARTYMQMGDQQQAAEWSARLSDIKQRHAAAIAREKKTSPIRVRSSTLLQGGTLTSDDTGAP